MSENITFSVSGSETYYHKDWLKTKGFKSFTRPIKTPNGTLTKVFVGPSLSKNELQSQLPALKELTKLNGKVTQFEVAK